MRIKKILIWLPAIVMAMIIFGFSKQDGEESSGLSYKAADIILTVCDKAGIIDCNENNRESMIEAVQFPIRKAAHMTEYAIFSIFVMIALLQRHPTQRLINIPIQIIGPLHPVTIFLCIFFFSNNSILALASCSDDRLKRSLSIKLCFLCHYSLTPFKNSSINDL